MSRPRQLFLTTTIALLAAAAMGGSAWAATAEVITVQVPLQDDTDTVSVASLTAAPGEVNRVRISPGATAGEVLIEDLGPVLGVGTGCVSVDDHHARCTSQIGERVVVNAGDQSDVVDTSPGVAIDANGGDGTDLISGADESDLLDGGGGSVDGLRGFGGNDVLTDGDGIGGAPINSDVFDGGPGSDTIDYTTRSAGVKVRLKRVHQPEDVIAFIENLDGGKGDDEFTGSDAKNTFNGGPGKDVLVGGRNVDTVDGGIGDDDIRSGDGSDVVTGGKGKDRIALGKGNDRIDDSDQFRPTGVDEINCGAGSDRVIATQDTSIDKLPKSCERFTAAERLVDGNQIFSSDAITVRLHGVRRSGMDVVVPVKCERPFGLAACVITGRLKGPDGGATLAKPIARKTLKAGKSGVLRLRLTAAGLARVDKGKQFRLLIADRTARSKLEFEARARAQTQTYLF